MTFLMRRSPKEADIMPVAAIPTVAGLAPPPPSDLYRRDPNYAAGQSDLRSGTRSRAFSAHRAWLARHDAVTTEVHRWLAETGLMGEQARSAHAAYTDAARLRRQAEADVASARARLDVARADLAEGVRAARAGGDLPKGDAALKADLELLAADAVLGEVKRSEQGVNQAWGRAIDRADWGGILAQVELLDGPDADTAAAWLRRRLGQFVGPDRDPIGWV